MVKNLVIVESPAKAKTIERFLGSEYLVRSSFGHVRDLSKKGLGVDIENGFKPHYEISPEKVKIVNDLKKSAKEAEVVWLASDEDREGEAIAWHLKEALNLKEEKIQRIVFHEITKNAILEAINNPRGIDINLVNAQQARRVLDRLVGFEISPVLWKKIKPALSAGRVQSVAVRLIIERENEIKSFSSSAFFRVTALFDITNEAGNNSFQAELNVKFRNAEEARTFLEKCIPATYSVAGIDKKPAKKSPAPPFTTSTLQQEAGRKLGLSVEKTMQVAQQLYESGKITYMRTDSLNLSDLALGVAKKTITGMFGPEYVKIRRYRTTSKGAQEAHEAIRPTYIENQDIDGDAAQKKLYDLIWKRTIASQMSDALLEKTEVTIDISTCDTEKFIASGEVIKFDGFLKVYIESTDDETSSNGSAILPQLFVGDSPGMNEMQATQRFSQQPYRYAEASLVRKLEELGIGRPSTYAPTISTIQKRGYVVKQNKEGISRHYLNMILKKGKIKEETKTEKTGYEKNKLFPTDIGIIVNDFLLQYFVNILDYNFTANVEKEFDEIASGNKKWNLMIKGFYSSFHKQVEVTMKTSERASGERLLGKDPKTGKNVYVKLGKFGPMVQIGDTEDNEKPRFAGLNKGQSIDTITLEDAFTLFSLPRVAGKLNNEEIVTGIGRFGPYLKLNNKFYSLPAKENPYTITEKRAIEIIEEKIKKETETKEKNARYPLKLGDLNGLEVWVALGRYGAYLKHGAENIPIGKNAKPDTITFNKAVELINAHKEKSNKKIIREFPGEEGIRIMNGRYGPYITNGKENFKLPKGKNPVMLTLDDCRTIIQQGSSGETRKKTGSSKKSK